MAWTLEQLTSLEQAIAEGTLEVEYEDKRVKYRSLEDMKRIRAMMRQELGLNSNPNGRRTLASFSKGLKP